MVLAFVLAASSFVALLLVLRELDDSMSSRLVDEALYDKALFEFVETRGEAGSTISSQVDTLSCKV